MRVTALLLVFSLGLSAESPVHKWTRRVLAAAACAASSVDGYQTAVHVGKGVTEGNPLLARRGGANVKRMIGLKVGICAAPAIVGEFTRGKSVGTALSLGGAAAFSLIDVRNGAVLRAQEGK